MVLFRSLAFAIRKIRHWEYSRKHVIVTIFTPMYIIKAKLIWIIIITVTLRTDLHNILILALRFFDIFFWNCSTFKGQTSGQVCENIETDVLRREPQIVSQWRQNQKTHTFVSFSEKAWCHKKKRFWRFILMAC